MTENVDFDLKRGLNAWLLKNTSLTDFANALGYKYPNAWGLVRGKVPVTVETVGRFALAYGPAALGEMLILAGLTETHEVTFKNGVPLATRLAGDRADLTNVDTHELVYVQAEEGA